MTGVEGKCSRSATVVGKEAVPLAVAVNGIECKESFVTGQRPELAGQLETALILGAGGLYGP